MLARMQINLNIYLILSIFKLMVAGVSGVHLVCVQPPVGAALSPARGDVTAPGPLAVACLAQGLGKRDNSVPTTPVHVINL
jgi:hypothetical protein